MPLSLPSLQQPAVDTQSGRFSIAWVGFFTRLTGKPAAIQAVNLTGSPFGYTAAANGALAVFGGSSVTATLTRGRVSVPISVGLIPLSEGDEVVLTYSSAPTVSFVPR
jgi:hypothetical protein